MKKTLFLDCDSTLCAIEGVDELAALRGPEIEQQVIELTHQAMDGSIPISEIFSRRLDLIRPDETMCQLVGQMYIDRLSEGVTEALDTLRSEGWEPIIISGGFTQVIEPVAKKLEISTVYAVDLHFDSQGNYQKFDPESPTARNGGKPDIIKEHLAISPAEVSAMIGDGISDLETQDIVSLFIGYGGIITRTAVKKEAQEFVDSFADVPSILRKLSH